MRTFVNALMLSSLTEKTRQYFNNLGKLSKFEKERRGYILNIMHVSCSFFSAEKIGVIVSLHSAEPFPHRPFSIFYKKNSKSR